MHFASKMRHFASVEDCVWLVIVCDGVGQPRQEHYDKPRRNGDPG